MSHAVYLAIDTATYDKFKYVEAQLNEGSKDKLAHELGEVLADASVQVIEQVFIQLLERQKARSLQADRQQMAKDSEKVIDHVLAACKKYLPWSIALISNERLVPLVEYFSQLIVHQEEQVFIRYAVDDVLVDEAFTKIDEVRDGQAASIPDAFICLNKIIDAGVDQLVRTPKTLLKFNFVVNKTLNGAIQVSTNMAYKRLAALGKEVHIESAPHYIDHFLSFLQTDNKKSSS